MPPLTFVLILAFTSCCVSQRMPPNERRPGLNKKILGSVLPSEDNFSTKRGQAHAIQNLKSSDLKKSGGAMSGQGMADAAMTSRILEHDQIRKERNRRLIFGGNQNTTRKTFDSLPPPAKKGIKLFTEAVKTVGQYLWTRLYPLNVIKFDDIAAMKNCFTPDVRKRLRNWASTSLKARIEAGFEKDKGPGLLFMGGDFRSTKACLKKVVTGIVSRRKKRRLIVGNLTSGVTDRAINAALKLLNYTDLTVTLEFGFQGCFGLRGCAYGGVGLAISTTTGQCNIYYSTALSLDTSFSTGTSWEFTVQLLNSMDAVTGTAHGLSVSASPIGWPFSPSVSVLVGQVDCLTGNFRKDYPFIGFALGISISATDGPDLQSFSPFKKISIGYTQAYAAWLDTLGLQGTVFTQILKITQCNPVVVQSGSTFTVPPIALVSKSDVYKKGGFTLPNTAGAFIARVSYGQEWNATCPRSGWPNATDGKFRLGFLQIFDVVFGNMDKYNCNSTRASQIVRQQCEGETFCKIRVDFSTLGSDPCVNVGIPAEEQYLQILFTCPASSEVYNLNCRSADFSTIVENDWYMEGKHPLLMDSWESRTNGIAKCAQVATERGLPGFGIISRGMCLMGRGFLEMGIDNESTRVYNDTVCPTNGKGSGGAYNMYAFIPESGVVSWTNVGCRDLVEFGPRYVHLENLTNLLVAGDASGDNAWRQNATLARVVALTDRKNALLQCARLAKDHRYSSFALQSSGDCLGSNDYVRANLIKSISNYTECGHGLGRLYASNANTHESEGPTQLSTTQIALVSVGVLVGLLICCVIVACGLMQCGYLKDIRDSLPSCEAPNCDLNCCEEKESDEKDGDDEQSCNCLAKWCERNDENVSTLIEVVSPPEDLVANVLGETGSSPNPKGLPPPNTAKPKPRPPVPPVPPRVS